ncbi:dihydrofolate reductase family protein [Ruania halotolerans]|uniref:dihydrofolate reductase family protein n=1 Tax=Ruania halotolerans TaxID=2897773 RepID=UPI001E403C35|nr:dihydrofolate reductase family protein [Ruania halotolerans]UFU08198.1 dihydrofolate reductase family protein [Ruania halotolerans]
MTLVTADMNISLDGYAAGPDQSLSAPFGEGPVDVLSNWMFEAADENAVEIAALNGADAYIMGRNMFGPDRGPLDQDWQGWWGPEPPYHAPVFVLSHYPREPLELTGTTFTFVTDGIDHALGLASRAAGDGRVDIAGGAHTVNEYLSAGLIDELRVHVTPVIIGGGARLFEGVGSIHLEQTGGRAASTVTHLTYRVHSPSPTDPTTENRKST